MLTRLLPATVTNDYRGYPVAVWVFAILTAITLVRSLIHMLAPDGGAQSIATIPLDTYTTAGAQAVVYLFALWGLSQLLLGLFYAVVLWRYRTLIPLMYLLMAVEYALRIWLTQFKPLETTGTAPGAVADYIIVPLALVMGALALQPRDNRQ